MAPAAATTTDPASFPISILSLPTGSVRSVSKVFSSFSMAIEVAAICMAEISNSMMTKGKP